MVSIDLPTMKIINYHLYIIGLIPARYQSSRLPGKPLLKFGTETMIQKVYQQTIQSELIDKAYVLTDDIRVKESVEEIGGNCLMITDECLNGTERICIAINKHPELFQNVKYIVNVQGDEPYINPKHIDTAIRKMNDSKEKLISNSNIKCSTLHYRIEKEEELNNTSIGKLVLNYNDEIMYCSRNCIPANKSQGPNLKRCNYYAHIGLFVFDFEYLKNNYYNKPNTPLQLEEDIEWLKLLEQGNRIVSSCVDDYEIGVNLPEDYTYLLNKYQLN